MMTGRIKTIAGIGLLAVLAMPLSASAQGLQLFGIGPVNRGMGGAATGAPLEAIGGLAYNPATLTVMPDQLSIAVEGVTPLVDIQSSLGPSRGNASSDGGWAVIPALGLAWKPWDDSRTTVGIGLFGIAGYALNHPASSTSPILFPQTPTAATPTPGFGNVYADVNLIQFTPTLSVQVTERLSVAAGPTVTTGRLVASPFVFAAPDDANGDGVFTYPVGAGTSFSWGGGFQLGAYYEADNFWNFGASFRSPQWMKPFEYNGTDELGRPRSFTFDFDYPLQVSTGISYTGIDCLTIACDVRYLDWDSAKTVGSQAGFAADGSVVGLGWESTWSVSVGLQWEATESLALRTGYTWAENPISSATAGYSVGAPLTLQHAINMGATTKLSDQLLMHLVYYYAPDSDASGPFQSPAGPVPGSQVRYDVSAHGLAIGLTAMY